VSTFDIRMSTGVLDRTIAGTNASIPFIVCAGVGFCSTGNETHLAIGCQSLGTAMVASPGYLVGAFFQVQYAHPTISGTRSNIALVLAIIS